MSTQTARWLNEHEMLAWRRFIETQDDLLSAFEADLASTGLSLGDYQVLVYLSEVDDHRMRMTDLADILQLSPSGLTRRLDGLVRDGLVCRETSSADRRVTCAVLTDAGRQALTAAAPQHVESVRHRLMDLLEPAEIDALATIFGKVRAALDS